MTSEKRIERLERDLDQTRKAAMFLAMEFMSKCPERRQATVAELEDMVPQLDPTVARLARDIADALRG